MRQRCLAAGVRGVTSDNQTPTAYCRATYFSNLCRYGKTNLLFLVTLSNNEQKSFVSLEQKVGLIGYHAFGGGGRDGTVGGNKGMLMGDESVGVRP